MTDAVLLALPVASSPDELESPARRALRRLFKRKGAVIGLVVIATFILLALFAPSSPPTIRSPQAGRWYGNPRRHSIGSAPTISAATS